MDTKKSVAILLAFIVLAAGNVSCTAMAQPEPEPEFEREREDEESSNALVASCLLKIASDPTVMPISDKILDRLVNSSSVLDKAAREVGGITPEDILDVFVEQLSTTADGFAYVFHLQYDRNKQTEELMAAVIDNLSRALHNDYEQSLQQLGRQLELAKVEAVRAEHELVSFQKELRELAGSRGSLSRQAIVEEIAKLRDKIQTSESEIEYNRASIGFSRNKVRQVRTELNSQLEKDTIIHDLEKLIEDSAARLDTAKLQQQAGRRIALDLADLEEKLIKLKIELAERREELSKSAGANKVDELNEEIAEYSRRIDEEEAYVNVHRVNLEEIQGLIEKADRYEILSIKASRAKENLKEAIKLRDELRRKIRMIQPPVVSVLGGPGEDDTR